MEKSIKKRNRLSVDVTTEEHRMIKTYAAINNETIREYVLEAVRERLRKEKEKEQMFDLTTNISSVLKELWDNEKDASYDKI